MIYLLEKFPVITAAPASGKNGNNKHFIDSGGNKLIHFAYIVMAEIEYSLNADPRRSGRNFPWLQKTRTEFPECTPQC